jgi:membrane fusion protein, multidrug efflux system
MPIRIFSRSLQQRPSTTLIKRTLLMLAVLALAFGALFSWKTMQFDEAGRRMAQRPPTVVSSVRVQTESWEPYLSATGTLTASQGISVSNEVAGLITGIHFVSGQTVNKGDLLLQLDDSVARAELLGLKAQERFARLDLKRDRALIAKKYVSRAGLDRAETTLDEAIAQVKAKQALIAKKQIRAPFSGRLGIRQVNLGEYIAPGARIVSLQALDPIYADYTLPEHHLAELHVGQPVRVLIRAYQDAIFEGRISAIAPEIDKETRSLKIRVMLPDPQKKLRPGMFVETRTVLPLRRNLLTLPRTAITFAPYGASVYVIERSGETATVQRRTVQTGQIRGERVEVGEGLVAGTEVVSAGQIKLRNGMSVVIDNSITLDALEPPE